MIALYLKLKNQNSLTFYSVNLTVLGQIPKLNSMCIFYPVGHTPLSNIGCFMYISDMSRPLTPFILGYLIYYFLC